VRGIGRPCRRTPKCRFAPKLEVEQLTVEGQSLLDITDLQLHVIEINGARACFIGIAG
jgi:hypothetical protein